MERPNSDLARETVRSFLRENAGQKFSANFLHFECNCDQSQIDMNEALTGAAAQPADGKFFREKQLDEDSGTDRVHFWFEHNG